MFRLFSLLIAAICVSVVESHCNETSALQSWRLNSDYNSIILNTSESAEKRQLSAAAPKPTCSIVVRDKIRGHLNWMQDWFLKAAKNNCKHTVSVTERPSPAEASSADIYLYHAPSHTISNKLREQNQNKKATIAMISMEQPKYAHVLANLDYLRKNVDLMLTYSLSDVYPGTDVPNLPITYYPLNIVSPLAVMQPSRGFAEKTGYDTGVTVAIFASNCKAAGATARYKYIEELMKHIDVHSYGKCLNNRAEPGVASIPEDPRWPPIAQRRARKIKILSQYKFYLAFENAPIEDYVSEKVFEGLIAGTLPIYQGSSSIHKFMPANYSYIDANNMNPQQLAEKLKFLASNEDEYNKYFEYKKLPLSQEFQEMALKTYVHPNVLCRLCEYALD